MIKEKGTIVITALLMTAVVLFTGYAYIYPEALAVVTGKAEPKYVSELNKDSVLEIQIIAEEKQWTEMLENALQEEYIPATVIINGTKMENVGVRPKGNSSLSMVARDDSTDRYSFKLEFDHYIVGQTWLGLDKLAVNNMQGDATYMKEYLSYDIMRYVGVEAPLYAYTEITVNGQEWGLYLAVEVMEESYTERVYGTDHGKLYKPEGTGGNGFGGGAMEVPAGVNPGEGGRQNVMRPEGNWRGIVQGEDGVFEAGEIPRQDGGRAGLMQQEGERAGLMQQDGERVEMMQQGGERIGRGFGGGGMASNGVSLQYTDDNPDSYPAIFDNAVFKTTDKDYLRVVEALKKLSEGKDLESAVDIEACLKYFAAHTVVVNLDSYISNMGHNYYLYEKDGQLTILPWDYNLAFGGFQSGNGSTVVNFPIDTPYSGVTAEDRPLLGKLLEVAEYKELYHRYLGEIVEGYIKNGQFEEKVDSLDTMISDYVAKDMTAFYNHSQYKAAVEELKKLGVLRGESIDGQLNGTVPSTMAGQSAEPEKLIDASGINLTLMGSQGGDGMGGFVGGMRDIGQMPQEERVNQMQNPVQQQSRNSGGETRNWILLGITLLLITGGTIFVFMSKRR